MINWIKSLFGRGQVRAEWEGIDQSGHTRAGNAKAPYIGRWDDNAMKNYITEQLLYHHGITVTKMQIVAHIED